MQWEKLKQFKFEETDMHMKNYERYKDRKSTAYDQVMPQWFQQQVMM